MREKNGEESSWSPHLVVFSYYTVSPHTSLHDDGYTCHIFLANAGLHQPSITALPKKTQQTA